MQKCIIETRNADFGNSRPFSGSNYCLSEHNFHWMQLRLLCNVCKHSLRLWAELTPGSVAKLLPWSLDMLLTSRQQKKNTLNKWRAISIKVLKGRYIAIFVYICIFTFWRNGKLTLKYKWNVKLCPQLLKRLHHDFVHRGAAVLVSSGWLVFFPFCKWSWRHLSPRDFHQGTVWCKRTTFDVRLTETHPSI